MPDRNKRFRGKPKKIKIVSNNTDFFSPEPEEEIEQKLTVSSSGDEVIFVALCELRDVCGVGLELCKVSDAVHRVFRSGIDRLRNGVEVSVYFSGGLIARCGKQLFCIALERVL